MDSRDMRQVVAVERLAEIVRPWRLSESGSWRLSLRRFRPTQSRRLATQRRWLRVVTGKK
jgi:hypothetical protein